MLEPASGRGYHPPSPTLPGVEPLEVGAAGAGGPDHGYWTKRREMRAAPLQNGAEFILTELPDVHHYHGLTTVGAGPGDSQSLPGPSAPTGATTGGCSGKCR